MGVQIDLNAHFSLHRISLKSGLRKQYCQPCENVETRKYRKDQNADQKGDKSENEYIIARRSLTVPCCTRPDQIHVLLISLPNEIEGIADKWNSANNVVEPDIVRHPQQRDLRNAVANSGK